MDCSFSSAIKVCARLSLAVALSGLFAQSQAVNISCIGNSITDQGYPDTMAKILTPPGWSIRKFGQSGACAARPDSAFNNAGFNPIMYNASLTSNPNIVVIELGLNDAKASKWGDIKDGFYDLFFFLCMRYRGLATAPKVFICRPIPVGTNSYGIDPQIVKTELLALVDSVIRATPEDEPTLRLFCGIDIYSAFLNHPSLLKDGVHPSEEGKRVFAQTVADAIRSSVCFPAAAQNVIVRRTAAVNDPLAALLTPATGSSVIVFPVSAAKSLNKTGFTVNGRNARSAAVGK